MHACMHVCVCETMVVFCLVGWLPALLVGSRAGWLVGRLGERGQKTHQKGSIKTLKRINNKFKKDQKLFMTYEAK